MSVLVTGREQYFWQNWFKRVFASAMLSAFPVTRGLKDETPGPAEMGATARGAMGFGETTGRETAG